MELKNLKIPRCLGICLFFNDDDIVVDAIRHLLNNNHEVLVFDHSSSDKTLEILEEHADCLLDIISIPKSIDLYQVFEHVSRYVIENYAPHYDWVSFPESDEFLEGPDRKKSYFEHVIDVYNSEYDWIRFNNIVFWFTESDDMSIQSPIERIRHYSRFKRCLPSVYAWRASSMNIRWFNHNPARGEKYPIAFNTRHYQVRSKEHMLKRFRYRTGLSKGVLNNHFDYMQCNSSKLFIPAEELHFDDQKSELRQDEFFDWFKVYGTNKLKWAADIPSPNVTSDVDEISRTR